MSKLSKENLSEVSILSLIDWRREIFAIYSDLRRESNGKIAWEKWRVKREELFKNHPESPTFNIKSIPGSYAQPILYPYNPNFCLSSKYKVLESSEILELLTDDNSVNPPALLIASPKVIPLVNGYVPGLFTLSLIHI